MNDRQARSLRYLRGIRPALYASHMSTTINGEQLADVLDMVDELAAKLTEMEAKLPKRGTKAKPSWTEPLADAIPIVNEMLQNHAECWGQSLRAGLDAYSGQADEPVDEKLIAAIDQALGNGD